MIPGNYTIFVTLMNSALVERTFVISILAIQTGIQKNSKTSVTYVTQGLVRVVSASIDVFGLVTVKLVPSPYNYKGRVLQASNVVSISFNARGTH